MCKDLDIFLKCRLYTATGNEIASQIVNQALPLVFKMFKKLGFTLKIHLRFFFMKYSFFSPPNLWSVNYCLVSTADKKKCVFFGSKHITERNTLVSRLVICFTQSFRVTLSFSFIVQIILKRSSKMLKVHRVFRKLY